MKRIISSVLLLLCLQLFAVLPVQAEGVDSSLKTERITLFESEIVQTHDTKISIVEKIHYNFPSKRHGMFREIPVSYKVKGGFQRPTILKLDHIKYYPENNSTNVESSYSESSEKGYKVFKIGDPDKYISGQYVFEISYSLLNATNFFDTHDELYLNVNGTNWQVPIDNIKATVTVPGNIDSYKCFTGSRGSTNENCLVSNLSTEGSNKILFEAKNLNSNENMTFAISMPKGSLQDTRDSQRLQFLLANIGILLPIPVILFLFYFVKRGNKNKKLAVIPHYRPIEGIYPLISSKILHDANVNKAISAEIIQLAVDGYLKIEQVGDKKYVLHKTVKSIDALERPQSVLFNGLFDGKDSISVDKFADNFYKTFQTLNSSLSDAEKSEGYLDKGRKSLKNTLSIVGICIVVIAVACWGFVFENALFGWFVGFIISGIASFVSSSHVDTRTALANEKYYELLGLKMYINTAEKNRIEFHNDPKKYSGVFEKLLPYAIIFGLEKKWAKEFEGIYTQPDWYTGNFDSFDTYMLTRSISNINGSVNKTASKAYSSSSGGSGGSGFSGGSSGGGFGGGGGGSW